MSHTYRHGSTLFICNPDLSGELTIHSVDTQQSIELSAATDVLEFIVGYQRREEESRRNSMTGDKHDVSIKINLTCEKCWTTSKASFRTHMEIQDDTDRNGETVYKCPTCGATVLVSVSVGN